MKQKYRNKINHIKKKFGIVIYQIEKDDWIEDVTESLSKREVLITHPLSTFVDERAKPLSTKPRRNFRNLLNIASISFKKELLRYDYRTFNKVPMNIHSEQSINMLLRKTSGEYKSFKERRKAIKERKKRNRNYLIRKLYL